MVPQVQLVGKELGRRSSETEALPAQSVHPILPFALGGPGTIKPGQAGEPERTQVALTHSSLRGHLVFTDADATLRSPIQIRPRSPKAGFPAP